MSPGIEHVEKTSTLHELFGHFLDCLLYLNYCLPAIAASSIERKVAVLQAEPADGFLKRFVLTVLPSVVIQVVVEQDNAPFDQPLTEMIEDAFG